ncbi:radical SAM protein [Candidatus Sumerlaeota bacterium]|nr:radical SAM protein [Candidatus Sumerlaeota bacterium]
MRMSLLRALRRSAYFYGSEALGLPIRPMKLRLAVTNRCNARCRMCSVWQTRQDASNELAPAEYDRLFERSKRFLSAVRHVSLTGGEPLLRDDLEEIVRIVHRRLPRATFNVNTNAFRTDRLTNLARALVEASVPMHYNVSLDGLGAAHDEMRGVPGASKMALRSLDALLDMKASGAALKIGVNHVITDDNFLECEQVHDYCRARRIAFNPILPMFGEFFHNETMRFDLSDAARERLIPFFERLAKEEPGERLAYCEILDQIRRRPRDFRCWAGRIMLLIEEHGEVYPNGGCPRDWTLGNLRTFDFRLRRLVASPQARDAMRKVARCRTCRLSCETLTTLKYPEALAARRKLRSLGG